ncbi:MAG: hypothetical protein AVDCRST_MAG34-1540 [uncultured Nocardioidaceae bacterium]|uniref:Sulfotransferase domain-containing protein n=1 Tax=uncultured Nocardioidaceae bacterium TaxID=253824 RepID=A0A6J4L5K8_9ACTN|nr:MAG: hypothetical protein AVDCRST_MAG34-1540 [uncultured Nocardioidaceae bacterium]
MSGAARTILVHVGAPKTGTSFLQDLLLHSQATLAERGVLYPADRFDAHFLAALDLMELPWGGLEREAVGAWDRLAEQVRAWEGTVIISHEILATASAAHVARALSSFGEDSEVHIVMSARDLVRQIPAEWQENVKHRRTVGYREFLDAIRDPDSTSKVAAWFWGVQDIPATLGRWAADVPPERVHLVTVPGSGAPRELLWERFATVFGLDPADFDTAVAQRANPSLGVAESALVRRLNTRVNNGVLRNEHYREFVRELLAHRTLSWRQEVVRLRLPADVQAWAVDLSRQWIDELGARGYDVVGSLEDLRPVASHEGDYLDPDGELDLTEPALQGLAALLVRAGEMRDEIDGLHRHVGFLSEERDQARREVGLLLRKRRQFVAMADRSRSAALALGAYRRVKRLARG